MKHGSVFVCVTASVAVRRAARAAHSDGLQFADALHVPFADARRPPGATTELRGVGPARFRTDGQANRGNSDDSVYYVDTVRLLRGDRGPGAAHPGGLPAAGGPDAASANLRDHGDSALLHSAVVAVAQRGQFELD